MTPSQSLVIMAMLAACSAHAGKQNVSGRDVYGHPAGLNVQGKPNDLNAQGNRPKDIEGNPPHDLYGNRVGTESKS